MHAQPGTVGSPEFEDKVTFEHTITITVKRSDIKEGYAPEDVAKEQSILFDSIINPAPEGVEVGIRYSVR